MQSASSGGILKGALQALYVHILFVAPLGTSHMAESGTNQHKGGVAVRETAHHPGTAADLPVQPFNQVIGGQCKIKCVSYWSSNLHTLPL